MESRERSGRRARAADSVPRGSREAALLSEREALTVTGQVECHMVSWSVSLHRPTSSDHGEQISLAFSFPLAFSLARWPVIGQNAAESSPTLPDPSLPEFPAI